MSLHPVRGLYAFFKKLSPRRNKDQSEKRVREPVVGDVSERQLTEKALQASEHRYRALFDSASDAIFIHDREGCFLEVNQVACERLGYSREELLQMSPMDIDTGEYDDLVPERIQEVFDRGHAFFETAHVRRDGVVIPIELSSRVIEYEGHPAILSVARDITERKRTEEALRRRNRELALLNRASQALSASLDLDRVLVTVLEEVRRMLGVVAGSVWLIDREREEVVCQHATGVYNDVVRGWRLALGEGIVGWVARHGENMIVPDTRVDARHFKGVDQRIGLELRSIVSVPLRVQQVVIGVLQVVDTAVDRFGSPDLTLLESLAGSAAVAIENARLVEALRQYTVELEARNEELDAFAHTVAHDLKGPLGHMVGYAYTLSQDHETLSSEALRHYLHTIARNGYKMNNIIDELLVLAGVHKMEQVEMHPLDMGRIICDVQKRLKFMIEEYQADIIMPSAGDWPVVLGYAPWVEEIWVNYLSNAIKYGGRPPRVEMGFEESTSQRDLGEASEELSRALSRAVCESAPTRELADAQIRFWVQDNGPGLTPEQQARLFTPFERLGRYRVKGHGLGLSIVQRIAEKLGGEVGVESQCGQGSVFFFTLSAN